MRSVEFSKIIIAVVAIGMSADSMMVAATEKVWTRSEILAVADAEAKRLNYDVEQKSVSFSKDNREWQQYLNDAEAKNAGYGKVRKTLQNREFWAVRYEDIGTPTLGGELWVLVDRETGEVINTVPFWKDQP